MPENVNLLVTTVSVAVLKYDFMPSHSCFKSKKYGLI